MCFPGVFWTLQIHRALTIKAQVLLTNHLSLIVDHHCQVLEDLVDIHDVRLKQIDRQKARISCDPT